VGSASQRTTFPQVTAGSLSQRPNPAQIRCRIREGPAKLPKAGGGMRLSEHLGSQQPRLS